MLFQHLQDENRNIVISENDVLFGRGGNNNKHSGNKRLRVLGKTHKAAYNIASKKQKSEISRSIVEYIKSQSPPGRFLKKHAITGKWEGVEDDAAREKVSQVLRDAQLDSSPADPYGSFWKMEGQAPQSVNVTEDPSRQEMNPYGDDSHRSWSRMLPPDESYDATHTPTRYHDSHGHYDTADHRYPRPQNASLSSYGRYNPSSYHYGYYESTDRNHSHSIFQDVVGSPPTPVIEPVPLSDIDPCMIPPLSSMHPVYPDRNDHYNDERRYDDRHYGGHEYRRPPSRSRTHDDDLPILSHYHPVDPYTFEERHSSTTYSRGQALSEAVSSKNATVQHAHLSHHHQGAGSRHLDDPGHGVQSSLVNTVTPSNPATSRSSQVEDHGCPSFFDGPFSSGDR